MTYQEMLDALAAMDEPQRRTAIQTHWQAVLSDGFIGFVQGQLESGKKMVNAEAEFERFFAEMDPSLVSVLKQSALMRLTEVGRVWNSMVGVYEKLQKASERQGNTGGMVAHGRHTAMPRGRSVPAAAQCYRCGSPAVGQGLCSGCLATQQDWEQEDQEYDRQLYERQQQDLDYQRLQDDQLYYTQQQDFNSYTDYNSEY